MLFRIYSKYLLLYEYRDLRAIEWRIKIPISLDTIFFTLEIRRTSVLIGHTIFFTSENLSYERFHWLTFFCLHMFTG
jgi:hypothetical protein